MAAAETINVFTVVLAITWNASIVHVIGDEESMNIQHPMITPEIYQVKKVCFNCSAPINWYGSVRAWLHENDIRSVFCRSSNTLQATPSVVVVGGGTVVFQKHVNTKKLAARKAVKARVAAMRKRDKVGRRSL